MKILIDDIRKYCNFNYERIAVAENITTGCLQMMLGGVTGAETFFSGGITAFNYTQLSTQLNLPAASLRKSNMDNMWLTIEMAKRVAAQFNSEIGIAINGCKENEEGLYDPCYAAIVHMNTLIYSEKLVPMAQVPSAIPIEYSQRLIRILHQKLVPAYEECSITTELLETYT